MGWECAGMGVSGDDRAIKGKRKTATEPTGRGRVGLVLRPSHKFSRFLETFHLGITLHLAPYINSYK